MQSGVLTGEKICGRGNIRLDNEFSKTDGKLKEKTQRVY